MVEGFTSPTATPPEVMMASSTGRAPAMSMEKVLEQPHEAAALLPGDGVDLAVGRDAAARHHRVDHLPGQQVPQGVEKVAVDVLFKVREQPPVQGLLIQGGLQVEHAI